MKSILLKSFVFTLILFTYQFTFAQHTFSIVAIDSLTGEIGSAGATCLDNVILNGEEGALVVSDIILGIGAIHTQAWWTPVNQNAARARMIAGDSPEEIIAWLQSNDNGSQGGNIDDRQYGIVGFSNGNVKSAAFTGNDNFSIAGHITGPNYSIQGNILIEQAVLDDMETAFLNTQGTLADKLMAAMQGAKRPGADSRCLSEGVSSLSAFLRVATPEDTDASYGNLTIDINIGATPFGIDPIDDLQIAYDDLVSSNSNIAFNKSNIRIYPNPTSESKIMIELDNPDIEKVQISNSIGEIIQEITRDNFVHGNFSLDIDSFENGVYFVHLINNNKTLSSTKFVKL